MKPLRKSRTVLLTLSIVIALGMSCSAFTVAEELDWAFRKKDWEKVVRLGEKATGVGHGTRQFPASYGSLYYKFGVGLWNLGKWKEASTCFERCYVKFPNRFSNPYKDMALKGWADCAKRLGDTNTAFRMTAIYAKEASPREKQKPTPFDHPPAILKKEKPSP